MIEEFDYILVIQFIHDLDFKLDLIDKVVLYDLGLVDHLDRIDVLTCLMTNFVNLSEATDADIGIGQGLEIILPALSFLPICHARRQEKNPTLDVIDFAAELGWHLNCCWLTFHIFYLHWF